MMNSFVKVVFVSAFLLFTVDASLAKEWRGIEPLRSTRADVVRIFNRCSDQREACVFSLSDEDVFILFSGALTNEYSRCAKSLNPETVIFIQVEPRRKLRLDDLHINKKTLEVLKPSFDIGRGVKGYRTRDNLVVSTVRGRILQLNYLGAVPDVHPCAPYYEEPASFIQTLARFVTVVLECPSETKAGSRLAITANSGISPKRGPTWTVDGGTITSGQHTYTIMLDTSGLAEQTIQVTAELRDVFGHTVVAGCTIQVVGS